MKIIKSIIASIIKKFKKPKQMSITEWHKELIKIAEPYFGTNCVSVFVEATRYSSGEVNVEYKCHIHTKSTPAVITCYDVLRPLERSKSPQESISNIEERIKQYFNTEKKEVFDIYIY